MTHMKTLIALSVIASSLLAGPAFAGRAGGFIKQVPSAKQAPSAKQVPSAKQAEQGQRAGVASGPTQTVAPQKQLRIK